jgi:hypothetical protein
MEMEKDEKFVCFGLMSLLERQLYLCCRMD